MNDWITDRPWESKSTPLNVRQFECATSCKNSPDGVISCAECHVAIDSETTHWYDKWERSGCPKRVKPVWRAKSMSMSDEVRRWLTEFSDGTENGLLFMGPTGTGKTTLLCRCIDKLCRDGVWAHYLNWPVHLHMMRASIGSTDTLETDSIVSLCKAPVLAIDDIGREKSSEWTKQTLYTVIESRYSNAMPTLIATNEPPVAWDSKFGEAVASRMHEMCEVLYILGEDRRRIGN